MITRTEAGKPVSAMRLLEMLELRFGAFETIAWMSLRLADAESDGCLPMDRKTAEAVLEFGDDLRQAHTALQRNAPRS